MTSSILSSHDSLSTLPPLDASFATINWQAPWLIHLNQRNYLSKQVENLSQRSNYEDEPSANYKDGANHSTTVVANLLNTAMTQQMAISKNQPQTKPTFVNQAKPLTFVSQDALPEGEAYESFIAKTGNIPTRDNLHDLFNGSIWLTFPKTKALLNYYHMVEMTARMSEEGNSDSRGRVRDTITVFDENGAVLVTADPSIGEALIDFDWQGSLVAPRAKWDNPYEPNKNAQAAVYIFGHALLEQLIQPRKPLCAHSVIIHVAPDFFALTLAERIVCLDNKLAEYMNELLSQDSVTPRQLAPLPILGVPHFWSQNAEAEFYEDSYVFRSGRRRQT